MGVYLANSQLNDIVSKFEPLRVEGNIICTWDGFLYYINENPLKFTTDNYNVLDDDLYQELVTNIKKSSWLRNKKGLIDQLNDIKSMEKWEQSKSLGDFFYKSGELDKSLEYYLKSIEDLQAFDELRDDQKKKLDRCYANIGIILITIGHISEGIEQLEYAYKLNKSHSIFLDLTKFRLAFNRFEDSSTLDSFIDKILSYPSNDEKLAFLVWYYHDIGEYENSMTSYMQIKDIDIRFNLVDYYMGYMLESNQCIAMESFLKPLKDFNSGLYYLNLIQVYISLENYQEALKVLETVDFPKEMMNNLYILKSMSYLGLKRIIESISAINAITVSSLTEKDQENYYVQLAKLSKYSRDISKEHVYNRQLLHFWQQKYRKIYSKILHNTNWKVRK